MSEIKRLRKMADKIYAKMENMQRLTDSELKGKTDEFKLRLKNGETVDQIMPDAYAAVGEAAYRSIGLRPYKVQIMGAIALNEGKIAEMKTGEGKSVSLCTPMPTPDGWKTAGDIKVGDMLFDRHGKPTKVTGVYPQGKKQIYEVHLADGRVVDAADEHLWSVYQTGRKGLKTLNTADMFNKGLREGKSYRFRLPMNDAVEYAKADLPVDPYVLGAFLGNGCRKETHALEFSSGNDFVPNEIAKSLDVDVFKAHKDNNSWIFRKHGDDNHRLHGYDICPELDELLTQTKCGDKYIPDIYKTASIKQRWALLHGFKDIYHMSVVKIPTNKPVQRIDDSDKMFLTRQSKFKAVVDEIKKTHETGQPILVGTSTIQDSEILDKMLKEENLPHTVLNAKFLEKEAEIIAKAGTKGSITIATNMAGRGTDIKLDDDAKAAGGLKVIGTQRHESRRIDNQLKGRSGRQGDPGESIFFLSLDDEVLRLYGSERMKNMLSLAGMKNEESLENGTVNKFVKKAQTVIEDNNFGARKNVLKFDKVNNEQRELIYAERDAILEKADTRSTMVTMIEDSINMVIDKHAPDKKVTDAQYQEIRKEIEVLVHGIKSPGYEPNMKKKRLSELYINAAKDKYVDREREWLDINVFREFERQIILRCIDIKWMQHINDLEILRQNIALVGYGQKDPAIVYKLKAFDMFNKMSDEIKTDSVYTLFSSRLKSSAANNGAA